LLDGALRLEASRNYLINSQKIPATATKPSVKTSVQPRRRERIAGSNIGIAKKIVERKFPGPSPMHGEAVAFFFAPGITPAWGFASQGWGPFLRARGPRLS
jgi:hypothetical protein